MRVLVVIDMQKKYLSGYDEKLLSNINYEIKLAHEEEDVPIFYVKNVGLTGNRDGYDLSDELLMVSDLVFEKKSPSAFSSKAFSQKLKGLKATELEIVGVDGTSCVAKTAMDAAKLGYKTEIVRKCVGARNEKVYEKTLKKLEDAGINIL
ncbi:MULTISPECIES: cysteine hydrolase family protein [unclassified Butyrivibrio]|uniref:cysteine hydrolase family protein n=1 Tax=unclassified Butyrivibrio TaxID=2639466 RepID=UPI0003B3CCC0|nr:MULTISPECIES: isochorismatase family cysteine hydrolase [unclassified Butyrivibrio]SDB66760.1 Nicotinamidase-related amidase [Butyrivibrio sp. INlla16]SEM16031.1 Nicotinamidase-related amidase [Butyrivibrio sp. ob235]